MTANFFYPTEAKLNYLLISSRLLRVAVVANTKIFEGFLSV